MQDYEKRKSEHIDLSLKEKNQVQDNGLSRIKLIHEALPDLNWNQIDLSTALFGKKHKTPFFAAGMTGGSRESSRINYLIASVCEQRGWIMGAGSQRKQLFDPAAGREWQELKKSFPKLTLVGNLGLSQFIQAPIEKIEELFNSLWAVTLFIHANSLQECLQPEGTPQFKGGIQALKKWAQKISLSLKETGCGFSLSTLESLAGIGLKAVDISGYGGTHWGRIETDRILDSKNKKVGETFAYWGNSTLSSLLSAQKVKNKDYEVWASGGLRNGLDGAKCIALGAGAIGFAHLILKKALKGEKELDEQMFLIEEELKIALFCTGCKNIQELKGKWEWI